MSKGQAAQGEVSAHECFGHHAVHIPIETVAMTRPFAQRIAEMNAMSLATGKISSRVLENWRRVPLTHPSTVRPSAES